MNESARYYQKKLIARPPPGRTLARSSRRLNTPLFHSYAHSSANQMAKQPLANGSSSESSNGLPTTSTTINRGPNRVDTGSSRMLAGIMGSSSVLNSSSANALDDEALLLDPEAVAANEMKRFCKAVEQVVCAHLNRWKWKRGDESLGFATTPRIDQTAIYSSDSSFKTGNESNESFNDITDREDAMHSAELKLKSPFLEPDADVSRSRASTVSSYSSTTDNRSIADDQDSKSPPARRSRPNLLPSLPKEYQWAHQTAEVSATSTLFTLDRASLHDDQSSGQMVQPEYHPDLILLCSPFVKCIRAEPGMYFAFEKLMSMRGERLVQDVRSSLTMPNSLSFSRGIQYHSSSPLANIHIPHPLSHNASRLVRLFRRRGSRHDRFSFSLASTPPSSGDED
jgi:hypothetical protein